MYYVRVKTDYRWRTARVAGREFSKAGEAVPDEAMVDEVRNSPLLDVRHLDVDATDAAQALAAERGVDLTQISGSGAGGRIVKADVVAALEEM